jgi:single-stranded DNA-binding protein
MSSVGIEPAKCNFESITINGYVASDILLKVKTKERLEFFVIVNKQSNGNHSKKAKWFKVVIFDEELVLMVKNNLQFYKKGTNVEIQGEIEFETYKQKPLFKVLARSTKSINTRV